LKIGRSGKVLEAIEFLGKKSSWEKFGKTSACYCVEVRLMWETGDGGFFVLYVIRKIGFYLPHMEYEGSIGLVMRK
jgi:hypothetical protein